jgi:hypothetical protein
MYHNIMLGGLRRSIVWALVSTLETRGLGRAPKDIIGIKCVVQNVKHSWTVNLLHFGLGQGDVFSALSTRLIAALTLFLFMQLLVSGSFTRIHHGLGAM